MPTHRVAFLDSLDRCIVKGEFLEAFYQHFMDSSEEIRKRFRFTDFEKQQGMLLNSLKLSAGATDGDSQSLQDLRERAETHDRYHLDIKPELYEFWIASIIQTASEYDQQWDDEIEESWRTILEFVVARMIKHY